YHESHDDPKLNSIPTRRSSDLKVLNKVGAFATLFDGSFPEYKHPVLVFKTEEPGSKQKLALENDSVETICQDLINHLINDAIVIDRKSTRLNSSHLGISYAVFC